MTRVVVALLLEQEHGVRRLEGILRPGARRFRQSVQVGENGVIGFEPVPVFPPDLVSVAVDDHQRLADGPGVLHDVGSAPFASRRIAVPDGKQHVCAIDSLDSAIEVGFLPVTVVVVDDAHMIGGSQDFLHRRPFGWREVLGKLGARQGQDCMPGQTKDPRLP